MPIPTPNDGESHEDFMDRCMGNDTMVDEYPDNDQRYAVCQSSWDKSKGKSAGKALCERTYGPDKLTMELREAKDGEPTKLVGHAAVFGEPTDFGSFHEQIAAGAFTDAIKEDDVRALFNHDPNIILGRTRANTLRLWEDDRGLGVEITPPDTQQARDIVQSISRGDVDQMSFAFIPMVEEWDESVKPPMRTIKKAKLYDVSPVVYPAYEGTDIAARKYDRAADMRAAHRARMAAIKANDTEDQKAKEEAAKARAEFRKRLESMKR